MELHDLPLVLLRLRSRTYAEKTKKKHIITTSIEHKSVLETVKEMEKRGFEVDIVDPDISGHVNASEILSRVKENTLLVSVMHVNNETGVIQPVDEIGKELAQRGILFHVDATQSCGKLVPELQHLQYDLLSFSAHKLRGPQGVGVLVLRKKGYRKPPVNAITYGGQQEGGIRPGTIPVALVAGCGKACELAEQEYKVNLEKLHSIKQLLKDMLEHSGLEYTFNGDQEKCVDNTMNLCISNLSSEALMLSTKQYCGIANGSACTSKIYSPSYVLTAMGVPDEQIRSSIRISWGPDVNVDELKFNFARLLTTANRMVLF